MDIRSQWLQEFLDSKSQNDRFRKYKKQNFKTKKKARSLSFKLLLHLGFNLVVSYVEEIYHQGPQFLPEFHAIPGISVLSVGFEKRFITIQN
jgi:hypothetical protein